MFQVLWYGLDPCQNFPSVYIATWKPCGPLLLYWVMMDEEITHLLTQESPVKFVQTAGFKPFLPDIKEQPLLSNMYAPGIMKAV